MIPLNPNIDPRSYLNIPQQGASGISLYEPGGSSTGLTYSDGATAGNSPLFIAPTGVLGSATNRFSTPAPAGGSGGASQFKDTAAQRSSAYSALDALGGVQQNRLTDEDIAYQNLMGNYDAEVGSERTKFNDQTMSNEKTLASGSQAAMLAAAQGGRGLRATLAAMGALGGTGSILADRAITDSANKDLGGAQENFETNAKTLQTSWGDFEDSDKRRRKAAETTRDTNKKSVEADVLTQRQKLLQELAGFYEQAGNTGNYNAKMAEATSLTPQIASKSAPRQAYARDTASFNPAQLDSYLAGNRDMTVGREAGATTGTALNNPLYAFTGKKDEELV